MWVTCYADASYSRGTGGAWAVWLRCDEGRLVRNGACPPYVRDATAAELAAIFAGVFLATTRWGPRVRGIGVRSDSQGALLLAARDAKLSRNDGLKRLQLKLRDLLDERKVELDGRWVRGHQPLANGTAAFLNRRCDRLANHARRALVRGASRAPDAR